MVQIHSPRIFFLVQFPGLVGLMFASVRYSNLRIIRAK